MSAADASTFVVVGFGADTLLIRVTGLSLAATAAEPVAPFVPSEAPRWRRRLQARYPRW